jgi:hypothetical protein
MAANGTFTPVEPFIAYEALAVKTKNEYFPDLKHERGDPWLG